MRVYMCSRVAPDAHPLNDKVAAFLRRAGLETFVPHEAPHNQVGSSDEDVYRLDMAEMQLADACVVVGRIGVDCAFEVGWFQSHGTPTIWYTPGGAGQKPGHHPMLHVVPRTNRMQRIVDFLENCLDQRADGAGDAA